MPTMATEHAKNFLNGAEDKIVTTKSFDIYQGVSAKSSCYMDGTAYFNGRFIATTRTVNLVQGENIIEYSILPNKGDPFFAYRYITYIDNLPPTFSINSNDLGDISSFEDVSYTITEPEGEAFTLVEKLDNAIIRTLENQASGTNYTLSLEDRWQNIDYGNHTIEIVATDARGRSSKVAITFRKIKSPIPPLVTTASLKQAIAHNKEIESELIFQLWKFKDTLNSKGITTTETDSISILIDKIRGLPSIAMYEEVRLNSEKIKELENINAENEKKISSLESEQETQNEEILSNMLATTEIFEMVLTMSAPMSVDIENKNKNLGGSSMVEVYVTLILKGVKTIDQVPAIIRDQVKAQLDLLTK